ncbi:unnamed protein product [Eretmochelys imbricata]
MENWEGGEWERVRRKCNRRSWGGGGGENWFRACAVSLRCRTVPLRVWRRGRRLRTARLSVASWELAVQRPVQKSSQGLFKQPSSLLMAYGVQISHVFNVGSSFKCCPVTSLM